MEDLGSDSNISDDEIDLDPVSIDKYLEMLGKNDLEQGFAQKDGDDVNLAFMQKWITLKTFLTYNTFLYGFP